MANTKWPSSNDSIVKWETKIDMDIETEMESSRFN